MQVTTQAGRRVAVAFAPGTCGELVQGVLPGGQRFHVTCPIDRGTTVSVRLEPAPRTQVVGLAGHLQKTKRALLRTAELLELPPTRIQVDHGSQLDRAKGLASSTADIVAAVRALATAHDIVLSPAEIGALAATLEPSDGVMHDGIVAVDQHSGQIVRAWDWWPQFTIAMLCPDEVRDTGDTGAPALHEHADTYADLIAQLDHAAQERCADGFARQATRSARLNETSVANPLAQRLFPHLAELGAAGLCVGHSGTVCGLLFHGPGASGRAAVALRRLAGEVPAGTRGTVVRTPPSPTLPPTGSALPSRCGIPGD